MSETENTPVDEPVSDSILNTIKIGIGGVTVDNTDFDPILIMLINTAFSTLKQIGVGDDFQITGPSAEWSDYGITDTSVLNMVKQYITHSVKIGFDPPVNSSALEVIKNEIARLEWRLNVYVDPESNPV